MVLFHVWKYLPLWTVIFLAARRGILIRSLLSRIFTMGDLTNAWLMTGGAPGDSAHVLAMLAYRHIFRIGKIDWGVGVFASALPVTLLLSFLLIEKIT